MPPKPNDSAIAQATKDTAFLASCFKHMKQKPEVDAAAVAAELKLSTGGVKSVKSTGSSPSGADQTIGINFVPF